MSSYETGSAADRGATGSPAGENPDTADVKERAVDSVAEVDAGAMYVAGVAGDEIQSVAHDVKDAAGGFFDETRVQLADQASTQQRRAADALRATGDELEGMASGTGAGSRGMATSAVRALGQQSRRAADWLEQREPADVVREVRGYARRHTGAFLLIALGVGIVAGRLTRALMNDAHSNAALPSGGSTRARPAVARGADGQGATTAAGAQRTTARDDVAGDTPIGDALATDQGVPSLPTGMGAAAAAPGEWSPSGGERP
ncbi:hypothetical protein ACFVSU_18520 [Microbacterium sp. NPDC058062]|uniref:hypothetical protein n=1 Tax=Microbacterium sp. NPDC058062 TaxID=3346320 RepID=UPI0036DC2723